MNITHDPKMFYLMLKLYTEKMLNGEKFSRYCTLQLHQELNNAINELSKVKNSKKNIFLR
jgi:hypothetical protein